MKTEQKIYEVMRSINPLEVQMWSKIKADSDGIELVQNSEVEPNDVLDEDGARDFMASTVAAVDSVWEIINARTKEIVQKSINYGAPASFIKEWKSGEGAQVLAEMVLTNAAAFNEIFTKDGVGSVVGYAVTSLQRKFSAFSRSEGTGGIVKRTTNIMYVVAADDEFKDTEYEILSRDKQNQIIAAVLKKLTTESIQKNQDSEDGYDLEIASPSFEPLADLLESKTMESLLVFVGNHPVEYPATFDVLNFKTGLMRDYTGDELYQEADRIAEMSGIVYDVELIIDLLPQMPVLDGILKVSTIRNKLAVSEIIGRDSVGKQQLINARKAVFKNVVETELSDFDVDGFRNMQGPMSIVGYIKLATMAGAEHIKTSPELDLMVEALCPVGSQNNKIDLVEQLGYHRKNEKLDLPPMPPIMQIQEQIALF